MTANRIIQHIFQQPALPQVSESTLGQLVTEYPYFTAAHLLLAKKIYNQYPNLHTPAVKKALLYSNNPHYFYQFVTGELEKAAVAPPVQIESQPVAVAVPDTTVHETVQVPDLPQAAEIPVAETVTEVDEIELPADEVIAVSTETAVEIELPVDEAVNTPEEDTVEIKEEAENEDEEEEITIADNEAVTANTSPAVHHATEDEEEPIKIFPYERPEEETTLTFQPLYTDDYFAYKRLKDPEKAEELNEKGMADMKSFTDWLREMKDGFAHKANKDWYHQQLHRSYEDEDPEVSETVEKMAMESITLNDDIVSETLAEIWARQHQYQTAIQIYQKLSLLNPNKSAYFAQKIQELQLLQLQRSETGKN